MKRVIFLTPGQGHCRHPRPHVGICRQPEQLQVLHRHRTDQVGILACPCPQPGAGSLQPRQARLQGLAVQRCIYTESTYFGGEAGQCLATVPQYLAPQQVERLDTVGTFIDLRNAHIAHPLLLKALATGVNSATRR